MAKQRYLMIIEPPADPKRELYGGWFPDLPGCFTAGRSIPHLRKMGAEAVSLYLSALALKGQARPRARHRADYVATEESGTISDGSPSLGRRNRPALRAAAAARNGSKRQITVKRKRKARR